jgi:hypothetical protein
MTWLAPRRYWKSTDPDVSRPTALCELAPNVDERAKTTVVEVALQLGIERLVMSNMRVQL